MEGLERITRAPDRMGGKPCIRDLRVTVGMIVGQIGAGRTFEQVLEDYPYLEREDILASLPYAAWQAEEQEWHSEMTTLERFENWYREQCNGDWEHGTGINISTLDNPGWSISINLRDTALEDRHIRSIKLERTEHDWMHAWTAEAMFQIRCGPSNLEEALFLFCEWAGGREPSLS